ncbi:MAG: PASTA domain-containing protein [Lachnospiraceae bacterium]|nr:PASTA domain-containing protein [Lachnospiraceae bacterium]
MIWTYEEIPKVPDVKNSEESEAKAVLEAAGYKVAVADEKTNDENLNNIVKNTDPKGGSSLKKGETVTMTVYRYDNGMIKVPNVIGQHWTQNGVKAQITDAGLAYTLVKIPNTESVDMTFIVASTDPGAGTELAPGTNVTVYIYDEYTASSEPDTEAPPEGGAEGE